MALPILDYTKEKGLVICSRPEEAINNSERLYIAEAHKLKAYAVLFRRFFRENADKPYHSEPTVCIFNEEDFVFNSEGHLILHSTLWSAGKNEIYLIIGKTRVDIINARKPAEKGYDNKLDVTNLKLAELLTGTNDERFSAHLFGKGTFWEQSEFRDKLDQKNSPYIHLLNYLLAVRKNFLDPKRGLSLEPATVDKLLVVSILVKFLEEIKDDDGKHTLQKIYKKHKVNYFSEAVERNLILDIFNELSEAFNGKIFDKFSSKEKAKIKNSNLRLLAQFLNADINLETNQIFLWKQYKFDHLPAEVISAIYENFIQAEAQRKDGKNEKGVVYTPIHLVNFLVDEVMPLDKPELFDNQIFRVLDPACGSGVFLVAAYKRLLQWWAINNQGTNGPVYPDSKTAQKILEDNIFGVDVKETAILVSIFGLTTALLGKLTPKEIWNRLVFKDLSEKNLQKENFFQWAVNAKKKNLMFDLVIGNPPFNPETGVKKREVLVPSIIHTLDFHHKKIPGENLALHFFEGSMKMSKNVCMILQSNVILYNKAAQSYRGKLFTDYTISSIYDFTHLRRSLFNADTPVVALIAQNTPSKSAPINHTVIKRMASSEKEIRFEIDYYDTHSVPLEWAKDISRQFIWKTNLLGGGRLFHLIYRMSLLPTFKDFILNKKSKNPEWAYGVGYKLKGSKLKPDIKYIYKKESIVTETFDEDEKFETFIEKNRDFAEPRDLKIYTPPHLIYKVNLGKKNIPIHFSEKYLCFKDKLVGLHAPTEHRGVLLNIYKKFKEKEFSALTKLWILSTSAETLVNLETAFKKEDIDSLPFSEEPLLLSISEDILKEDIFKYYIHLGKAITAKSAGVFLNENVKNSQLVDFGKTFCDTLNSIYLKKDKSWQLGKTYQTRFFTVCQLGYGKNNGLNHQFLDELDEGLTTILKEDNSKRGIVYRRIFRIYKHENGYDCIYLVKPHAFRYWLKSIALRDADDTFLDLKEAGF
jgi:type I restriction-modification system DNA methylase subunit